MFSPLRLLEMTSLSLELPLAVLKRSLATSLGLATILRVADFCMLAFALENALENYVCEWWSLCSDLRTLYYPVVTHTHLLTSDMESRVDQSTDTRQTKVRILPESKLVNHRFDRRCLQEYVRGVP